jgi:putative component of membrane protein insertase Oxa1/YidC/SpoIIIJ protein YidD
MKKSFILVEFCKHFVRRKKNHKLFGLEIHSFKEFFSYICSDVCKHFLVCSHFGKYYVSFIDE